MISLDCNQLLVTIVPDSRSTEGELFAFDRKTGEWELALGPYPVVIGKSGMTWEKREGDGKTPKGAYPLLAVFGKKEHNVSSMPFIEIQPFLEAIDDPNSCYYNQIIDRRYVEEIDWISSEKMSEIGSVYDLGIVIGYNTPEAIPGRGSCVYLHVWKSESEGTAGCTALSAEALQDVTQWLKTSHSPHIIQLPHQEAWRLPADLRIPYTWITRATSEITAIIPAGINEKEIINR